jgi:hypothetical protein
VLDEVITTDETAEVTEVTKVIAEAPEVSLNNTPLLFTELTYTALYNIDLSNEYLAVIMEAVGEVEAAIDSGEFTQEAIGHMQQEVVRLHSVISFVKSDVEKYDKWETEHYYAAKTWQFFMQHGYSEVVASAIIGNMMIETSGGSLNLKPKIYDPSGSFYGLCQWSLKYRPFVANKSFEWQLEYLMEDMSKEFKTFGKCYRNGFTYEDFLAMDDPGQAALAFAKVYERCGSGSYSLRQQAARTAYNYFVLGDI